MKFYLATLLLLSHAFQLEAFSSSSSFTTFRGGVSQQKNDRKDVTSRNIKLRSRKGTEMNMMFDQLASAIADVAKSIGGRQR